MKIKIIFTQHCISAQVVAQGQKSEFSVDYKTCSCQRIEDANTTPRYAPALDGMTNYIMFSKLITWKLVGGANVFKDLFHKNYVSSINTTGSSAWRKFVVTSRKPILFNHPQDSIAINLTPCQAQFYDFDVNTFTNYPVSQYVRNYEFEKEFDHYTQSYIDILCASVGNNETLLRHIFYYKTEKEAKEFIAVINEKYKINVVYGLVEGHIDPIFGYVEEDSDHVDAILLALQEKRIPFSQFLGEMIVKTNDKLRPINETEKQRLSDIFRLFVSKEDVTEVVHKLITPTINLSSEAKYIRFIIDRKILRNVESNNSTEILTRIDYFDFKTENGLTLNIQEICLPQSEITGTGVEISYTSGNVEFINSSRLVIADGVNLSIPSKKLNAEVKNVSINSKIISGEIVVSSNENTNEISRYLKRKGFKINSNNEKIHFEKTIK